MIQYFKPRFILSVIILFVLPYCTNNEEKGEQTTHAQAPQLTANVPDEYDVHLDLSAQSHLADVHHQGLFIDLGTDAQLKYTVGNWRSGWTLPKKKSLKQKSEPAFSYAAKRARVYFHLDEPQEIKATVRLKPYKTKALSPYINNNQLQAIFFEGSSFKEYTFTLPAEKTKKGENYLLFAFGDAEQIEGAEVSAAIDYIYLSSSTTKLSKKTITALRFESLQKNVKLKNGSHSALTAPSPSAFEWYVDVPQNGMLSVSIGSIASSKDSKKASKGKASVILTPEGGKQKTLFSGEVDNQWSQKSFDLSAFERQIVRIELRSEGAQIAWSAPRVWFKKKKTSAFDPAKNLIVVLTDTLRADKLPPYNTKTRVEAPTIDQVAKEGVVFESSQSPENWTKPSVASVLTALHPITHQTKRDSSKLPNEALMISEHLKSQGFKTGGFVANGYVSDKFGFEQGWNYFTNYIRENRSREAKDVYKEAGDWIEKNKDGRFFAYIQTIDPHVPYDPPEKYLKKYDATNYAGAVKPRMTAKLLEEAKQKKITFNPADKKRLEALHDGEITQHDYFMGKFIERMKKLGLWDNSVFVFVSDHGEEFNDHGSWGHGHSIYQELLFVPLIFRYPSAISGGTRVPQTVSTMDLSPTALELLGVKPLPDAEGRSLVPFIQGNIPYGPAAAFSDFLDDRRVMVANGWKFILRGNLTATMFNLQKDPGEKNQLSLNQNPIAERYMRTHLGQFLGAESKTDWYAQKHIAQKPKKSKKLKSNEADMDPTLKKQLQELGYGI